MQTVRDEEHNREAEAVEISSQNALVAKSAPREQVAGSSASKPVYINKDGLKQCGRLAKFEVTKNVLATVRGSRMRYERDQNSIAEVEKQERNQVQKPRGDRNRFCES